MTCPTCKRNVATKNGKFVRHIPLFRIPGRKTCPMGGQPVPADYTAVRELLPVWED